MSDLIMLAVCCAPVVAFLFFVLLNPVSTVLPCEPAPIVPAPESVLRH